MFDQTFIRGAIARSAETQMDRRKMLIATGVAGLGLGAAALIPAQSATAGETAAASPISDPSILNFALNLEYLEAEFYVRATTGAGLPDNMVGGKGTPGGVTGGKKVPFKTLAIQKYAEEIANDERAHVAFLRGALGGAAVSRPAIDLDASFTAAATAAGLIKPGQKFDPFADENSFLLGAFIFEDVGVTAYKGAAPFITNKTYLEAAAGILAVEAYHAATIRVNLARIGLYDQAHAISIARDSLDGKADLDQGLTRDGGNLNIVPADPNGLAFSRTPGQVLNIVFLNNKSVKSGGFFPKGVNGELATSDAN
jgi:hypothetical protein